MLFVFARLTADCGVTLWSQPAFSPIESAVNAAEATELDPDPRFLAYLSLIIDAFLGSMVTFIYAAGLEPNDFVVFFPVVGALCGVAAFSFGFFRNLMVKPKAVVSLLPQLKPVVPAQMRYVGIALLVPGIVVSIWGALSKTFPSLTAPLIICSILLLALTLVSIAMLEVCQCFAPAHAQPDVNANARDEGAAANAVQMAEVKHDEAVRVQIGPPVPPDTLLTPGPDQRPRQQQPAAAAHAAEPDPWQGAYM